MADGTIAAGIARALLDLAVSKGAAKPTLLRRCGIDESELQDQDHRIAIRKYVALMRAGKELCGDPALALHFGEAYDLAEISILGLVGRACERPTEVFTQVNRYAKLAADVDVPGGGRFHMLRATEGVWFVDRWGGRDEFPELTESVFARAVCTSRRMFGHARWVKAVHVTHPEPSYRAEYDRIFGMPVVFRSDKNALLMDASWLRQALPAPSPYARRLFAAHADALLERLESTRTVRGRVEELLTCALATGDVSVGAVARRLALSRQTLFRRLRAEGVTFEQCLRELRLKAATQYLGERNLSVRQTADLLGYSDATAFARAFKRWTGLSPRRYRQHYGPRRDQDGPPQTKGEDWTAGQPA